jgi:signal transduction histidine kinase
VELAVARERRSIARELHDVVGHAMSLIVLQAAAGRHLARTDPDGAAQALDAIADAGEQARVEVGRLRGVLEAGPAPGLDAVGAVVARAAAAGVDVHVRGGPGPSAVALSVEVDQVAFRVVQEALTNAMRHAGGAAVEIVLEQRDGALAVEVRNGPGAGGGSGEGGHGLRNMAERVAAVGGRLEAGPDGAGGWRVTAALPPAA